MVSADQPASRQLPEPPPITVPLCEQVRIERIPLTDPDDAPGGAGAEREQDYAVVLHAAPPAFAETGPVERVAVSDPKTSAEYGTPTGDAGGRDTGVV